MTRTFYLLISISLLISSCYYDNEEELYPSVVCNTQNVSYKSDIQPILTSKCLLCHSNASAPSIGNNIMLEGYNNLKVYVNNNKLLGSVMHSNGFSPMPKGGSKLVDCDLQKIESWINAGSPDN